MLLRSNWQPRLAPPCLASGIKQPSDRLATALAEDILMGRLGAGDRLPAHRDLAYRLGIGLGTVTKAYAVLEQRGLLRSAKGRGTFVAVAQSRRGPMIDLSRNAPPTSISHRTFAQTLTAIARRVDADLFSSYPPIAGHAEHRRLMAAWFGRLGTKVDPDHLLLTSGAQHALSVAFSMAVSTNSGPLVLMNSGPPPGR